MNKQQKTEIVNAVREYMTDHGLAQNDISKTAGVSPRYLIEMFRGNYSIQAGNNVTEIADKYFIRLAQMVDYSIEKKYWETQPTEQLKSITATLMDAKSNGETAVITGETGCGKTYTCKLFQRKYPGEVFIVTVGASDNLSDLLDKVLEVMHVDTLVRSKSSRIRLVVKELLKMGENGKDPVLIFDEAEYMKQPALCALKELYDALTDYCALVLIGTDQLTNNIEKLKRRNKPGIPQLYRRIKYRIRPLARIDRNFKAFLNGLETPLKAWLKQNCDNYGELHDVLVPAMREADRTGDKLTVEFVKIVLGE